MLAFLAAPLAGAFATVFIPFLVWIVLSLSNIRPADIRDFPLGMLFGAVVFGFPLTLFISLPLYLFLRDRMSHGLRGPILVSGVTTLVPCLLLDVFGRKMHRWDHLLVSPPGLLVGCFSGVVFWLVAVWRGPRLGVAALDELPRRVPRRLGGS